MKRAPRGLSSSPKRRAREPDKSDYEVGYCKPPKHSRFKRGGCRNPKGRPKGVRNIKADAVNTLRMSVKITLNGQPRTVSTQLAIFLRVREKALAGDRHAMSQMLQFARDYNSEELAAATAALSAEDLTVLAVYQARASSGVARGSAPREDKASEAQPVEPALPDGRPEPTPIERIPVKRRKSSGPEK
jgi:hypothetical protein